MNERRSELVERIHGEILSVYTDGYDHEVSDIVEHARRVITLVTKHRDAEIRELLLSEGAVDAANDAGHLDKNLGVMHHSGFDAVVAALAAIGLHGDGTGGQG